MRLSSFTILIVFVAIALIGYALLPQIEVRWLPSRGSSHIGITYYWPHAGPAALEQNVTAPLEANLASLPAIFKMNSESGRGNGRINLELEKGVDVEMVRFQVAARIRQVYPSLPDQVTYPSITLNRLDDEESQQALLIYSLSGPDRPDELYRYALDNLQAQLGSISDVDRVVVTGGNELVWKISYQPEVLDQLSLTVADLNQRLRDHFTTEAMGLLERRGHTYFVQRNTRADVDSLQVRDWEDIPLLRREGRIVYLRDAASIERLPQEPNRYFRINGENSIRLLSYPTDAANQLVLAQAIKEEVDQLRINLPTAYRLELETDNSAFLLEELSKIRSRTFLSLGILLLFVLLAYRSWRQLFYILAGLIITVGIAIIGYLWGAVELNLYAFAGITVSFGIVIDNSIVMVHHIRKHQNLRVFPALLGATLTTIAALSVIFFLPEHWRYNLVEMAKVIAINLGVSLLVSLLFIPALMRQFPGPTNSKTYWPARWQVKAIILHRRVLAWMLRYRAGFIALTLLAFGLPVFLLPNRVADWDLYNNTIGSEKYQEDIRPWVDRILGGTFRLFSYYVYEGSGFREPGETRLFAAAALPEGATANQMNEVLQLVEAYLEQFEEVSKYTTQIYDGQSGQVTVEFEEASQYVFPHILKNRLIGFGTNFGGVKWNIYGVGQGFSNAGGANVPRFRVLMKGFQDAALREWSLRFADSLLTHPRVQEVNIDANLNYWEKDRTEFLLSWQKQHLALANFTTSQLNDVLREFDQNSAPEFYLPNRIGVLLRPTDLEQRDVWRLLHQQERKDTQQIAFAQLAQLDRRKLSNAIHKEDQQYLRMVEFEYTGSARFGDQYLEDRLSELREQIPLGFSAEKRSWSFGEESEQLSWLMGLVVLLIFWICAILFESLRQAMMIILLIPISFIGIFLTFYGFEFSFDQGGYTSFLLVSGLVVNALILILNDFNDIRKKRPQRTTLDNFIRAYHQKILPITLTIFSTTLGLIPFLSGGSREVFWFALAAGTMGGLIFSLLVITLISPLFYQR